MFPYTVTHLDLLMMKKAFSPRRAPRKIGQDDDDPSPDSTEGEEVSGMLNKPRVFQGMLLTPSHSVQDALTLRLTESTLKRPVMKPRQKSSKRTPFNPTAVEDDQPEPTGVVTPKRSTLSRIAIQRNAAKRTSLNPSNLPSREQDNDDDRPSYSAASLQELKDSTPTTPRDISTDADTSEVETASNDVQALDLTSKFGNSLSRYQQSSAIPSATEIAEKKAPLAKDRAADEYISLNPSDPEFDDNEDDNVMRDENDRLVLKPKDKYSNSGTRLVRDDEDILEDFDDFTEADGKILVGRKAEAEAAQRRKQEMAAQIADAEAGSESESNASERERNEAFEAAQTKHGTYGSHAMNDPYTDVRPRTPPKISPLLTLEGVIERLRKQVSDMQTSRMQKLQEMEALQREKIRLGEEEIRIQKALRETADKFARLRAEKDISAQPVREGTPALLDVPSAAALGFAGDSGASTDVEQSNGARIGLGFGMAGRVLESLGTSTVSTPAGEDAHEDTPMDLDVR